MRGFSRFWSPVCFLWVSLWGIGGNFETLTVMDGLSQGQVLAITQDHHGFLWFGTQDGLNRYDGYRFEIFRAESGNPESLPNNRIQDLSIDAENHLWIATGGGLARLELDSGAVRVFRHDLSDASLPASEDITCLAPGPDGSIWVGTTRGLMILDPIAASFRVPESLEALLGERVSSVLVDRGGTLWIGLDNRLYRYADGAIEGYVHDPDNPASLSPGRISALVEDQSGNLWIATLGGGLARMETESGRFRHYRADEDDETSLSSDRVWSLTVDSQGRLFAGTMDRGLDRYHPESDSFESFRTQPDVRGSLPSNKIWSLYEDASGILWIGTGGQGIAKRRPLLKPFRSVRNHPGEDRVGDFVITSLHAPDTNSVWVGTWGRGLIHYRTDTGEAESFLLEAQQPLLIVAITRDSRERIWLGLWNTGLVHFDPENLSTRLFTWEDVQDPPQTYNPVDIIELDGKLWLATYGAGLVVFDPETEQFSRHAHDPENTDTISSNTLMCLLHDSEDRLWIGTVGAGLNRFDTASGEAVHYRHRVGDPTSLVSDRITCLEEDPEGWLWIGTDGGGLSRTEGDLFANLTTREGLPSNVINSVMADEDGHLWVGTNRGIARLTTATGRIVTYGPSEGLQLELNAGVYARGPSGDLFFGGQKGFDFFHPRDIRDNPHVPPVVFTSFHIFNEQIPLSGSPGEPAEIRLTHKQNFFSFEFAALDYANPTENRFAFMMEGFNEDWIQSGTRNYASYTNLGAGDYTFRVKASNNDGVWNPEGAAIAITVVPPFWQRRWFQVLVFLGSISLVAGAVSIVSLRKMRLLESRRAHAVETNKRMSEAREAERLRLARELHDGPIQDLHAIQLQMSMADIPGTSTIGGYVKRVIANLRNLCGELRPPSLGHFGLSVAIRAHVETLVEKHPDLDVRLDLMNDARGLSEETRLALFRICQEALGNAVQHAECGRIRVVFSWDAENIQLTISDDGKGFVNKDLFEWSRHGHFGLLGISERVRALGGSLQIDTGPELGTALNVLIPNLGNRSLAAS